MSGDQSLGEPPLSSYVNTISYTLVNVRDNMWLPYYKCINGFFNIGNRMTVEDCIVTYLFITAISFSAL